MTASSYLEVQATKWDKKSSRGRQKDVYNVNMWYWWKMSRGTKLKQLWLQN